MKRAGVTPGSLFVLAQVGPATKVSRIPKRRRNEMGKSSTRRQGTGRKDTTGKGLERKQAIIAGELHLLRPRAAVFTPKPLRKEKHKRDHRDDY